MIRFSLICSNGHSFESWFQSNEKFESLAESGHLACPTCNSSKVEKELMAPPVRASRRRKSAPQPMAANADPEGVEAIKAIRDHVEQNSDFVGDNFAKEARAMHEGLAPERSIHGQASAEDAKKLIEDGVPAVPLPFIPRRKTN